MDPGKRADSYRLAKLFEDTIVASRCFAWMIMTDGSDQYGRRCLDVYLLDIIEGRAGHRPNGPDVSAAFDQMALHEEPHSVLYLHILDNQPKEKVLAALKTAGKEIIYDHDYDISHPSGLPVEIVNLDPVEAHTPPVCSRCKTPMSIFTEPAERWLSKVIVRTPNLAGFRCTKCGYETHSLDSLAEFSKKCLGIALRYRERGLIPWLREELRANEDAQRLRDRVLTTQ